MKHKLLVASLTIFSACTLMACSHTTKKETAASSTKESSSKVEKKTSGLEMQIMVTSIFQVNGLNSRISM